MSKDSLSSIINNVGEQIKDLQSIIMILSQADLSYSLKPTLFDHLIKDSSLKLLKKCSESLLLIKNFQIEKNLELADIYEKKLVFITNDEFYQITTSNTYIDSFSDREEFNPIFDYEIYFNKSKYTFSRFVKSKITGEFKLIISSVPRKEIGKTDFHFYLLDLTQEYNSLINYLKTI